LGLTSELKPTWFQDHKGKQIAQAGSDSNSESQRKGKRIERYRSPSPTFDKEQDRIMEIIQRKIPCTFCGSKQHCVAVCWKQKVYSKKVMETRSMPRQGRCDTAGKEGSMCGFSTVKTRVSEIQWGFNSAKARLCQIRQCMELFLILLEEWAWERYMLEVASGVEML
jgi:hypothetical protein